MKSDIQQQKKGPTQTTTKESPTISSDNNDFTEKPPQADKETYQGEGDEREWEAPDINPKYPTDVQAEMADYAMSQDENDEIFGTENPGFMNRH